MAITAFLRTKIPEAVAALCLALGTGLRIWWAFEFDTLPNHDMKAYVDFAQGIADGRGYIAFGEPTAYWPVGYPATLAVLLELGSGDLLVARLAQALFGIASLVSVFVITRAYTASMVAAAAAAAWMAFDITQIAYTSILVSEPLFNCLMLVGAAVSVGNGLSWRRLLLGGMFFGLAAYTRAHGLLLPLLCGLFGTLGRWREWRPRARRVAWLYLGLGIIMAPWWVRNARVFDAFVPVSNNGGINLFIGNNPMATGGYKWNKKIKAPLSRAHRGRHRGGRGEYERSRAASHLAWNFMRENPKRTFELAQIKLRKLYHPDFISVRWNKPLATDEKAKTRSLKRTWKPRIRIYHGALGFIAALGVAVSLGYSWTAVTVAHGMTLLVAASYGFWWFVVASLGVWAMRLWRRPTQGPATALPVAIVTTFTLVHVLYFANGRFLHPMRPWMAVAAGCFLAWLVANVRSFAIPPRNIAALAAGTAPDPPTEMHDHGQSASQSNERV